LACNTDSPGIDRDSEEYRCKTNYGFFVWCVFGVFIYGAFFNIFDVFDRDGDDYYSHESKTFFENFSEEIEYANLELSAGVGFFSIRDKTSKLIKGTARGNIGTYSLYANHRDDKANLDIDFGKNSVTLFGTEIKNRLDISLNDTPIWDIELKLGAAKADFDLSKFKVSRISLETGATKTRIKIGDKLDRVNADVEMGAASLEFQIPQNFECKLTGDMVLIAKEIPGFVKRNSGYYTTPDYELADKKIMINVDGGVSSLTINRY